MNRLVPLMAGLALAALVPTTASAGTLYKCTGSDGIPNYSGKKIAGSHCKVVSTYTAADSRARGPAPVLHAPAAPAAGGPAPRAVPASRVTFSTAATAQALPAAASGARVTRGAVYKFERDGVTHYTNVAPAGGAKAKVLFTYIESCYACGVAPGVNFGNVALNMDSYAAEVRAAANEFGVEE